MMDAAPRLAQPCDFCLEAVTAGTYAMSNSMASPDVPFSRLIRRTSVVDVYAGLGALEVGYTIVLPRRHVLSTGELNQSEISRVWHTVDMMRARIKQTLPFDVVAFEHGSSGVADSQAQACISHAHVHLFPVANADSWTSFTRSSAVRISGYEELRKVALQKRNYYYTSISGEAGYLDLGPDLPSQAARRTWANLVGRPDEWDWAAVPCVSKVRETAVTLRWDHLSDREARADREQETIEAYEASAGWYAARTARFPTGSTLPQEIRDLCSASHGLILDAGCGAGRDAIEFHRLGRTVVGVDAAPGLLAAAAEKESSIAWLAGDIRGMPFPDESFGAIWCSAVLLHLEPGEAIRALEEMRRVLERDGLLQISVKHGTGRVTEPVPGTDLVRHFHFYSQDDLLQFAAASGLSVDRIWTEFEEGHGDSGQAWVKALLRRS